MNEWLRTWTATVTIGRETVAAEVSEYDLLKDQTQSAAREAMILSGGEEAKITMYKETKAHGRQADRSFQVYPYRGRIQIDGPFAA